MESHIGSEIKVGIFVFIGTIATLLSVLLLGGDQMFLTSTYELKARFNEVQGISRGSVISLAGYVVGNVTTIEFEPNQRTLIVSMDIDRDFQNRITEGSIASVKTQGALGDRYIYIEPGPLNGAPIVEGAYLEVSEEGDLLDVITEKTKELGTVTEVIKEAHILLKAVNHNGSSALLMENMVGATRELKNVASQARQILGEIQGEKQNSSQLKQSLTHMTNILEKVDRGEGSLGKIVNDPSLHEKLVGILGETPRNSFLKPMIRQSIRKSESAR